MNLDLLYETVENVEFFCDNNDPDKFYAQFKNNEGKIEFVPVDSKRFRGFLCKASYENPNTDEVLDPNAAVKSLYFLLSYEGSFEYTDVFNRTSGNLRDGIEYDLQQRDQTTVHVTCDGWHLASKTRKFVTSDTNLPQVKPKETTKSPLELLRPFVNITGDSYIIFVVWLIQSFTRGNHHALLIFAERGSGKSCLSNLISQIISPSKCNITRLSERIDDIRVLLNSSLLCCFDNVSTIRDDVSDLFCGAVTGTSMVKRSLYTDSDTSISTLHNIIVINGIGVVPEREDLAERMLILKLKKLKSDNIKPESELWEDFYNMLPEILGAIFNTLAKAMNEIGTIKVKDAPRMIDSYIELLAIAKALGITEEDFAKMYADNKNLLEQTRADSPIVSAIREYMATVPGRKVTGSAQQIYTEVFNNYSGDKALLPRSASHFNHALDNEHSNLLKAGYRANIDNTGAKGTVITIIKKK